MRERRVDLGLLVAALISAGKLGPPREVRMQGDAARALVRHDWPMNVRELEQCLRAAFVLADDDVITVDDLPPALGLVDAPEAASAPPIAGDDSRARIVALLAEHHGNVSAVARALQTSRSQIHRLMARYGISGSSRGS